MRLVCTQNWQVIRFTEKLKNTIHGGKPPAPRNGSHIRISPLLFHSAGSGGEAEIFAGVAGPWVAPDQLHLVRAMRWWCEQIHADQSDDLNAYHIDVPAGATVRHRYADGRTTESSARNFQAAVSRRTSGPIEMLVHASRRFASWPDSKRGRRVHSSTMQQQEERESRTARDRRASAAGVPRACRATAFTWLSVPRIRSLSIDIANNASPYPSGAEVAVAMSRGDRLARGSRGPSYCGACPVTTPAGLALVVPGPSGRAQPAFLARVQRRRRQVGVAYGIWGACRNRSAPRSWAAGSGEPFTHPGPAGHRADRSAGSRVSPRTAGSHRAEQMTWWAPAEAIAVRGLRDAGRCSASGRLPQRSRVAGSGDRGLRAVLRCCCRTPRPWACRVGIADTGRRLAGRVGGT